MEDQEQGKVSWMDLLWLAFLVGLAAMPPIGEIHKQLILVGIGLFQILEGRLLRPLPAYLCRYASVFVKIVLAALLVGHTGGIQSSYYLIYYLPVVSAAMLFDAWATLLWTALASATYLAYLIPALKVYELTPEAVPELAIRNIFFFLAAISVNLPVTENRRQTQRYQKLAETLAETNRRLEQAQAEARRAERLAALGQLSAGLAHEIRNPLGVIKGSAEMLQQKLGASNPLATELAGYISSEVNRLNGLVSRVLDFARPLRLERAPTEITPLVERALRNAHDQNPEAKVMVEREYADQLPQLSLDGELCERVFTNLVLNAYDAMGTEGGKLKVVIVPANCNGSRGVEIDFQDTGPGVPAELREQIFNPFFTTKKTGVGLGLSIVSRIVDEHRGWVRVTGEPGEGACFQVFFPGEEIPGAR
jgi:two-component system, NtrC family, sensor histidine kinase HydH